MNVQAIVDQIHLYPAIGRLMPLLKGLQGRVLITDALQARVLGASAEFVRIHDGTV